MSAKIGYLFSQFPTISTTFLQREVRGLRKLGLSPLLCANRPPAPGGFHPRDQDLLASTFYLNPVRPGRYLRAIGRRFLHAPGRFARALILAFALHERSPAQVCRNLARLAGAAVLSEYLLENNVRHLHAHFAFGAAAVAIFVEALSGIPFSLSIHGSDVLLPQPQLREKLLRARFIITNCDYHTKNLRRQYPVLHGQKFHRIRLGLDLDDPLWRPAPPPTPPPPLHLLMVARLEAVKAPELVVYACSMLKERGVPFLCRIAGDGPLKKNLVALIKEKNLADMVELIGTRYEQEISDLLAWSQVCVLSSKSEGTPMTIIEAMARGRAVVVPDITALPEMVSHGQTGFLFPAGSIVALADTLARFVDQPEMAATMGAQGRITVELNFELHHNAAQLQAVFDAEIPTPS